MSKAKAYFDQLLIEIEDLEHQLAEKRKNKDNLGCAIKKNEASLKKEEERISKCFQDKEDIDKALPASAKAIEDAEKLQNELAK